MSWIVWLVLCGIFLIVEIFTVSFLMLWPGIGAFFAFVTSLFTSNVAIQIGVFAVTTILMILFMKPIVKKLFKTKDTPMNINSIIGKNAIVIKEINTLEGVGQVKISGELWSAFSDEETIEKGATVSIENIEGVKLKVKRV